MSTPQKIRLIPREGLKLRDPMTGKPIGHDGIVVKLPLSTFWRKRKSEGDVIEVPETAPNEA